MPVGVYGNTTIMALIPLTFIASVTYKYSKIAKKALQNLKWLGFYMDNLNETEKNKQEEKLSISLKKDTVMLLDDVARKKVHIAMKNGSFDIIDLIRSKRGRGVSYDSQINFLARIYLAVIDETLLTKDFVEKNPQLKKVLDHLNEINHFFLKNELE